MGRVIDRTSRWLTFAAAAWIVAALAGCAWIDTQQRAKVYKPTPGTMADWKPVSAHDEPLWIDLPVDKHADNSVNKGAGEGADEGAGEGANRSVDTPPRAAHSGAAPERLRAIWIAADAPDAPAVLYLHGTFRNMYFNQPKIAAIHEAGFSVLAIDYRGWGESSKLLPSEASIMQDAEAAWAEFARRVPQPRRRVLFGHSMGSGVAIELALRYRNPLGYGAVVVESAMTSMPDLVRDINPFGILLVPLVTQQFDSIEKIDRIDAPKWFLSGSADKTVPPQQTQRLYDTAHEVKHLVWFEGGSHSGLHTQYAQRYRTVWREIAAALRERSTARSH